MAGKLIFKTKTGARVLSATALAVLVSALAPLTASAATITWGTPALISADTDVNTNGTALYAYSGGLTTATTNVNGATFTAGSGFAAWGNVSFTSGFTGSSGTAFAVASSPFQDLSSAYTNVLRGGAFGGTTAGTVTMNGLTLGHSYTVQIWVNDSRATARAETINGTAVTLDYNNFDAIGGVGQYVLGYFTADNTNQAFAMTPNPTTGGTVQLNAINVRDNGLPLRTWLGSSSTSWGTAGNWSPALVPLPGDGITFNNLSTANLSTVPDVSYTLSSLTLSNAPSTVSIGGANAMTVSGGINLISSSQSLMITAPLVFSASQTWNVTNNGALAVNGGVSGSGALTLVGGGTVSFGGAATYTGNTTISAGKLVIGSAGTLASTNITLAGGATFDVSAESPNYALNGGAFKNSSAGAVINGTSDFSSGTISMTYDGVNAPFIQTNGTLTLSGGTVINVNNTGSVLGTGNHTIITAATAGNIGQITGSLPSVNLTGNGAVGAVSLAINGTGGLDLVVGVADVWTGASDTSWLTGGNWTTAASPNPGDPVLFNNLSTANLSTVLNADFFLSGVTVINPSGPVTIGGANNLGVSASGINLASASQNLTITAPLQVLADQPWNIATNRTLNINGGASGGSGVTITGAGAVNFNSTASYAGDTTVSSGSTLKMTTANVLPNGPGTGNMNVNGLLDLNGQPEAINGLNGSGVVNNTSGSPVTLTNNFNSANSTFNGIIQNTGGALALDVFSGNLTLNSSSNTYSGGTTFEQGAFLSFPSATAKYGTGPVTFKPGANSYTGATTFTNVLSLDSCYLRVGGGSLSVQNWSGPITITNGFQMSGDGGAGGVTLSGPMNIGAGGISITNFGGNGPNEGFGVSLTGDLLSGVISGSGGITYYCNGASSRLTVQGANTYSGGTIVNGTSNGKLNVGGGINPFSTGPVTLNAGAIIESAPGSATITNALTLNGGILESEAQFNNYNTLTWAGPITLTADSSLVQFENGTLNNNQSAGVVVSGPLNMGGFTLTCSSPFDAFVGSTISGSISGAGNILYNSFANNTLTISGSNTFSGTFRSVGTGKLSIGNVYALQNATLDMNAADAGSVTFNNRDVVIGALTGSRNLSLGVGSVSIGKNNTPTTYSGILSGSGSLTKIGSGTLTLSSNAYTGNTTVSVGTLSIAQTNLALNSTVTVASGAVLNLNYVGTNVVLALVLNGVSQPNGVYKSTTPGGYISGTGAIQVLNNLNVWTGGSSGEWSVNVIASPKNWTSNGLAADFVANNNVLFDDTLTGNNTVNISVANVSPIQVTFNNNKTNYTLSGNFGITGTSALIKNGAAAVTIVNTNTYTGNTIINSNKLTIANGGRLGNGIYAGSIYLGIGATLEYTNGLAGQTFSGPITGAGALTANATNQTLTLSNTVNSYSGLTTIANGMRLSTPTVANISPNTSFNIVGSSSIGGQLLLGAAGTIANNISMSGVGYQDTGLNFGAIRMAGGNIFTGTITLSGATARVGMFNGNVNNTFSGQITGTSGIEFMSAGNNNNIGNTVTLANTGTANNYTGNTFISCVDFNSSGWTGDTSILKLGANEQIPNGAGNGIVVFNGALAGHVTILELNGFNETINGVTNLSATGAIIRNTSTGASTLTIGDANTNSIYSGTITDAGTGKTLAITKIGSGTLTLSNANTYNGGTTINGGTLLINAISGTGTNAVTINSGGTLGGIGSITGLVTNKAGGILSPGVSASGKLTLSGNVTLLSGSTNTFVVNGSTPTNNTVILGAAVTYGGVLNIVTNGTFTVGQMFVLFTGSGATNASNFASIAGSPGSGKTFSFTNGVLSVVSIVTGPSGPARLTNSISGNTLSLSWPAGQGWRLQVQTNSLSVGLQTNWSYLTDGTASSTNITVDAAKPTVFYRLTYP